MHTVPCTFLSLSPSKEPLKALTNPSPQTTTTAPPGPSSRAPRAWPSTPCPPTPRRTSAPSTRYRYFHQLFYQIWNRPSVITSQLCHHRPPTQQTTPTINKKTPPHTHTHTTGRRRRLRAAAPRAAAQLGAARARQRRAGPDRHRRRHWSLGPARKPPPGPPDPRRCAALAPTGVPTSARARRAALVPLWARRHPVLRPRRGRRAGAQGGGARGAGAGGAVSRAALGAVGGGVVDG